jgi:adenosylhomocysteine nucleosidase
VAFAAGFFYDYTMNLGILCAIPEETKAFGTALQIATTQRIGDNDFHTGTLNGHAITLVECGIGKVNAAFAATVLCDHFKAKTLVFSGIAGGLDSVLQVGDVVIAELVTQFDYGRFQNGEIIPYRPGVPPLVPPERITGYALPAQLRSKLAPLLSVQLPAWDGRTPKIQFGRILTGDVFLNDSQQRKKLFAAHGAQAIEMEGAAVAQIAEKYHADAIIIRALSDLAGDDSHLDFASFGHYAAQAAAALVIETLALLKP